MCAVKSQLRGAEMARIAGRWLCHHHLHLLHQPLRLHRAHRLDPSDYETVDLSFFCKEGDLGYRCRRCSMAQLRVYDLKFGTSVPGMVIGKNTSLCVYTKKVLIAW